MDCQKYVNFDIFQAKMQKVFKIFKNFDFNFICSILGVEKAQNNAKYQKSLRALGAQELSLGIIFGDPPPQEKFLHKSLHKYIRYAPILKIFKNFRRLRRRF